MTLSHFPLSAMIASLTPLYYRQFLTHEYYSWVEQIGRIFLTCSVDHSFPANFLWEFCWPSQYWLLWSSCKLSRVHVHQTNISAHGWCEVHVVTRLIHYVFNVTDLLPNSLYRAARFANSWGILDFSVPSIIWVGAELCKSQHNALANCFARLRFLRDGKEKPSNRHYIKLKNLALLPEATSFCGQRGCWKRGN